MGKEEKGSHKERVEAMQKKFDVSHLVSYRLLHIICDLLYIVGSHLRFHIQTEFRGRFSSYQWPSDGHQQ